MLTAIKQGKEIKVHTFFDSTLTAWLIYKESLPKKRGEYTYWLGDSIDGKHTIKGESLKDVTTQIHNKFGTFGK